MILENILILISISILFVCGAPNQTIETTKIDQQRTFQIDKINKDFIKDGKPFRFISGQFDYYRAHPKSWQHKLQTIRAAGFNAIATTVEWSLHNPKENIYKWDGIANLEKFIKLAAIEDLYVILRPGPFISGERELGGLPYWLFRKYPTIELRTSDQDFINENKIWYYELMKRIEPHLYGNGGPIILVQVENNYGDFRACDPEYFKWLQNEMDTYVKDKAVLFSYNGAECGTTSKILKTDSNENGPFIKIEYYVGWFSNWEDSLSKLNLETKELINLLNGGASVNLYMLYGGTNFGFTAGARTDSNGNNYKPSITSYDYDAPIDEAGDPTEKYFILREIIGNYIPLSNVTIPTSIPKKNYGYVELKPKFSILSEKGKQISENIISSKKPLSFETLDQHAGLVLYETKLPELKKDPVILKVDKIHDRGYVYVDNQFVGILSRSESINEIPIIGGNKTTLQIIVESQGRALYDNVPYDSKGILGNVHYGGKTLINWSMTKYPFDNWDKILSILKEQGEENCSSGELLPTDKKICENFNEFITEPIRENLLKRGPVIFYGELIIDQNDVGDTYLDTTGWGKGFIFINGFNLGRYWPVVGPQITLYVPKGVLKEGVNEIILVEYQNESSRKIKFINTPNLDGK